MSDGRKYWFPAKRYGVGWGVPATWQGRAVLAAYIALALIGIPVIHAQRGSGAYFTFLVLLTAALLLVCWLTGEPLRTRTGRKP